MEDYRLEQSGQEVQDILNGAAMQTDLTAENDRAELAEQALQGNIDGEALARETADGVLQGHINDEETRAKAAEKQNADDIDAIEEKIPSGASSQNKLATAGEVAAKQDALTFDNAPTPNSTNPVTSGGVHTAIDNEKGARINADAALQQSIEAILLLIPSAASALNQLADKSFVNSTVATASATFRGTYNLVSDLSLAVTATHAQIAAALAGAVSGADNNDYCFVQIPTSADTPTEIRVTERYKFNGETWAYEYDLNNSGFTAAQWEAINSAITSALVAKLSNLPDATQLATLFAGKQNTLTFDNAPASGSDNPVKSGGIYDAIAAITAVIPSAATSSNKLVDLNALTTYVTGIIGALDASFDLTSTDGHVTLKMTQVDGVITTLQILTSDIASAQALTTLSGQVSTNADDIAALQALYNALQQSAPQVIEPADTWPVASPSDTVIYRVIDRVNTPPQYYSDYMWNGTAMVLMATYNNAIDPRPKKGSTNLVTSGGVFDNMGALDVSELNATENPTHTLAEYATLSDALAAITSDYQKGGMSIKYVDSNSQKYVQYFNTSSVFTTDENTWAICSDSVYTDNPEWIKVITDKEGRVLCGIKPDGSVEWFVGIPTPIKEEFEGILNGSDTDAIDGVNKIIQYLAGVSVNNPLKETLDDIEDVIPEEVSDIEGRLEILLDEDERIICYRKPDGTKVENIGLETKKITAKEYDFSEQFIENLRKDIVIGKYNPATWYHQGYTYEAKGSTKLMPLVYKIPGNAYIGVVSYPDGTLFYTTPSNAQDPGHIVRVNKDGTHETLLTVPGNIRMFDFLWFDSHYNLYVSPQQCDKDENNINSGLYRLAYGADTFEHVLTLGSTIPAQMVYTCIREVTEDFNGNLYAGVYGGNERGTEDPSIYKSTDGGVTWEHLVNLDYMAPGGKHIHAIEYNPYDNKLYCVVGEVNKLLRSADGGVTWEDCNCTLELGKGFAMCMVPDGVLLGSDNAFKSGITKVYGDLTHKIVARTWFLAWPTFRVSDFTGWIYAFSRIDEGMTNDLNNFPPREAINDSDVLQAWKDGDYTSGAEPSNLAAWEEYNASVEPYSPENAVRPTQSAVLVSRDFGETWEILLRINESEYSNQTILSRSTGYFRNGEMSFTVGNNTFVISEGKHKYTEDGVDCEGDVLIRLNGGNTLVNPIY